MLSSRTVTAICFVGQLKLFLELDYVVTGDVGIAVLELNDFVVFAVGQIEELFPAFADRVDGCLVFVVSLILVELEHAELLLCLHNLELHIHGFVFDLSNHIEKGLDLVDTSHVLAKLLVVVFDFFHDSHECLFGNIVEDLTEQLEPLVNLFNRIALDFRIVDKHQGVLMAVGLSFDINFADLLETKNFHFDVGNRVRFLDVLLHLDQLVLVVDLLDLL